MTKAANPYNIPIEDLATHPVPMVTIQQLATYMRCSDQSLSYAVRKGALNAIRFGRVLRVPIEEACKYVGISRIEVARLEPTVMSSRSPEQRGGIYFVRSSDYIKIGSADNFRRRLTSLYYASPFPLELLAVLEMEAVTREGRLVVEYQLHDRFQPFRFKGEWFRADPKLVEFISANLHCVGIGTVPVCPPAHDLSTYQSWLTPHRPNRQEYPHPPH